MASGQRSQATGKTTSGKPRTRPPGSGYPGQELCPTKPEHGPLYEVEGLFGPYLYCPHHEHDVGTLTRSVWSYEDLRDAKRNLAASPVEQPATVPGPGKRRIAR
jgi:hypothetical protein